MKTKYNQPPRILQLYFCIEFERIVEKDPRFIGKTPVYFPFLYFLVEEKSTTIISFESLFEFDQMKAFDFDRSAANKQ